MDQSVMDHWTTVKRIHQSALDIDPSERAAFVDKSCGGDETLRREVQSLLTYAAEAETFLERPAVDIAPKPPSGSHEATLVGRTVSHYQVLSLLGAGGMGEVYLARDPRLDRTVALKILPGELAADPDRMQRFAREARAASALNHPNVATIYDVGESDGIPSSSWSTLRERPFCQESAVRSRRRKLSISRCRLRTPWMLPMQRA